MRTRATELLGIEAPVFCGGMLYFGEPNLAAAVSNAGGLGSITACNYDDPEELRSAIRETCELTERPFGVNITMLPSRFSQEHYDAWYRVCCEEAVAAIEAAGAPADRYVDAAHEAGVKMIQKVGCVRHAVHAEKAGFDAIYVAGYEEGGHPLSDNVTTIVLVPRVVDSVSIPVIAAGGIADGRGLAAALALGAEGVMMATRFLLSKESLLSDEVALSLIGYGEQDTCLLYENEFQQRAVKNAQAAKVRELERAGRSKREAAPLLRGALMLEANAQGDVDGAIWALGQSVGLIERRESCGTIVSSMVDAAERILGRKPLRQI